MRTFVVISLFISALAIIDSSPTAAEAPPVVSAPSGAANQLPLVVVTTGDSGAVLAGHPGGVGCDPETIYGCDAPVPNPTYVPPNIDPNLFEPGYHPDGFIVAELAERGVNAIVWPRAVFGSRSSVWARAGEAVCSPDPPGPEPPYCGKSPGEIAVEIWLLRLAGFPVVIWHSGGIGTVADVLDRTEPTPVAWNNTAEWDRRFAAEKAELIAGIDVLRTLAPDTPVILPGYANLNSQKTLPPPFPIACGFIAAAPFKAPPLLPTKWDQMYNPLINGGGVFNLFLGAGHPTGVGGMLRSIADADPTISFGDAALALRDDGATGPAWLPSPTSKLQPDCIHLNAAGEADLVSHVLDTVAPQIPGI